VKGFDRTRVTAALAALPEGQRVAFAASCCERLLPNYNAFVQQERWGQPAFLREALTAVWRQLSGEHLPEAEIRRLAVRCGEAAPNTEEFSGVFVSAALYAAAAISTTLECCLEASPEKVATVAELARDTIDQYLAIVNDPIGGPHVSGEGFYEWITEAPLMTAELLKQWHDIDQLASQDTLDAAFLDLLRASSASAGIQPFARGLLPRGRRRV
jgi:uncharacterized protein